MTDQASPAASVGIIFYGLRRHLSTLAGPLAFVLFIHRFQIVPEERILAGVFGAQYAEYRAKVRRWL